MCIKEGILIFCSGWVLTVLAVTLLQCSVIGRDYYNFQLAFNLFFNLSNYLLLLVVVWGVNSVLAERSGTSSSAIRLMIMGIVGVMGALTIALISLVSYLSWVSTSADYLTMSSSGLAATSMAYYQFGIAYWTLFLLSVIAAGGLAIATILRMRSRNIHVGVSLQLSHVNISTNEHLGYPAMDCCPLRLHGDMGGLPAHTFCLPL